MGELFPLGHLAQLSLETEVIERTEMTFLIMEIFIINRLQTGESEHGGPG